MKMFHYTGLVLLLIVAFTACSQKVNDPADVQALTIASAITTHLAEQSGYTMELGPEGQTTRLGVGLPALRERISSNYGRQCRTRAV